MRQLIATYNYSIFTTQSGVECDHLSIDFEGSLTNLSDLQQRLDSTDDVSILIELAYLKWGHSFVDQLEGAFVIVLFDPEKRELLVFRDKMGIVPCYYYKTDHFFACSTSVKSLLELKEVERVSNKTAIGDYISYGYVQAPETLISGVKQLLPAHYLKLTDDELEIQSYWSATAHFDYTVEGRTQEQHAFHIQQLLEDITIEDQLPLSDNSNNSNFGSLKKWISEVDHPSVHSLDYFVCLENAKKNRKRSINLIGSEILWAEGELYDTLEGFQSKRWLLSYPKNLRSILSRWVNIPHKSALKETYSQLIQQDYFDLDYLYPTYQRLYPKAKLQKSLGLVFLDSAQLIARASVVFQNQGFEFPYLSKVGLMEFQTKIVNAKLPALYDASKQLEQSCQLPFLEWKRFRYFLNLPDEHKTALRESKEFKIIREKSTPTELGFNIADIETKFLNEFAKRKYIQEPFETDLKNGFPRLTASKRNQLNKAIFILEAWFQENCINE